MMYYEERKQLTKFVKNMFERKNTNTGGGNITVKVSDEHILATPTLASKEYLWDIDPEQILVMDMDENIIEGRGKRTREIYMHYACYEENPDIGCVIHAHSQQALVYATLGLDMPNVTEGTQKLGEIKCLPPHKAYSKELAAEIRKHVREDQCYPKAYILAGHGILMVGDTLVNTYDNVDRLEYNAYVAIVKTIFEKLGVEGIRDTNVK